MVGWFLMQLLNKNWTIVSKMKYTEEHLRRAYNKALDDVMNLPQVKGNVFAESAIERLRKDVKREKVYPIDDHNLPEDSTGFSLFGALG